MELKTLKELLGKAATCEPNCNHQLFRCTKVLEAALQQKKEQLQLKRTSWKEQPKTYTPQRRDFAESIEREELKENVCELLSLMSSRKYCESGFKVRARTTSNCSKAVSFSAASPSHACTPEVAIAPRTLLIEAAKKDVCILQL